MRRSDAARAAAIVASIAMASACTHVPLSSPDGLSVGAPHPLLQHRAPGLSAADAISGARFDAKSLEGKVVVVHFWASWADASRSTLPKLQALYAKYKDRGVEIVALSVDDSSAPIGDVTDAFGVSFPVAWDSRKDVIRQWLVKSVPASFVVDRRGFVRAAFVGYQDGVDVEIETDLKLLTVDSAAPSGIARK
jgi:thiol-disulfide isomerase/thioredoxin